MKKTMAFVGGVVAFSAAAGAAVSYTGVPYSENFDGLVAASPTPFSSTTGVQVAVPGVSDWEATRWAGTATTAMPYATTAGTNNGGGMHNLGLVGDGERALGGLASGGQQPAFGVAITNNGTDALDSFSVTFDTEEWRRANGSTAVVNTTLFAWGLSTSAGLDATNFLTSALMTLDAQGDLISQAPVATSTDANLNTPLSTAVVVTISNINVPVGETIFLRWQDGDQFGSDAALAVDNFNFRATFVPTPGVAALLGLGGLLVARRRR